MYRDADVGAIEAAWAARDAAQLTEIGARLGIALDLPALAKLDALLHRAGTGVRRRDLIATLLNAATGEIGIATFEWERWLCLAVRHADRVVIGFARGTKLSKIWPDLKPWSTHYPSNRKRLDPWAERVADDRVAFGLIATAVPQAKSPPNTEELIQQIVENPHDRDLRAVLADLLVEHDQVRGKLMRLATEIDALPLQSDDRKKRELVVAQLIRQHGRALAGELADFATEYTFAGGFVDVVTMSAATFRDHGARLFVQQPIRRLKLQPANTAAIVALANAPTEVIRELHVYATDYRRQISFATLPVSQWSKLELLELEGMAAIDDQLAFSTLVAPRLTEIVFRTHIVTTTLHGIAQNRALCDHLEALTIHPTMSGAARLPNDGVIADAAFDAFDLPALRRLVLYRCWFATPERLAKLRARAPLLTDVDIEIVD